MSASDVSTGPANATLAQGLRELADFLDEHPELPEVRAAAWISEYRPGRNARADLTALALALGERAEEKPASSGNGARIEGLFSGVKLHAEAKLHELRGEPAPVVEYEPIILKPACGFCQGQPVADAATWQDGEPRPAAACPRCGERSADAGLVM